MKIFQLNTSFSQNTQEMKTIIHAITTTLQNNNGVALLPTETVYGLVCDAANKKAKERIYQLKLRDGCKPLQIFINSIEDLNALDAEISESCRKIVRRFCPGPLTVVIDSKNGTIGFRIPDHPLILELLKEYKRPLAATSANLSGSPTALNITTALSELNGEVDLAVDGGDIKNDALASTVIRLEKENFSILREGPITKEDIKNALKS